MDAQTRARNRMSGEWFNRPDAFATTLLALAYDTWGEDFLQAEPPWEPETLRLEVFDTFGVIADSDNILRLGFAITLLKTDEFEKNVKAFIRMCNVFSRQDWDPLVFDPATVMECAWGIAEAIILDDVDEQEFDEEIRGYLSFTLAEEGFVRIPDILIPYAGEQTADVLADYVDMPELYEAMSASQSDRAEEINQAVLHGMAELSSQLRSLQLRSGKSQQFAERMLQRVTPLLRELAQ